MKSLKFFLIPLLFAAAACGKGPVEGPGANSNHNPITLSSNGNGTVAAIVNDTKVSTAAPGTTVTITATPDADYSFVRWTTESAGVILADVKSETTTFTMPASEVKIRAEFESTVKYALDITAGVGGDAAASIDGENVVLAPAGETITLTATPDSDHKFSKWTITSGTGFVLANGTGATTTFTMPACDVAISAEFKFVQKYDISVTVAGGVGGVAGAVMNNTIVEKAAEGDYILLMAQPSTGYFFEKWTVTGGDVTLATPTASSTTFVMPAKAVGFEANFLVDDGTNDIFTKIPDPNFLAYLQIFDTNADTKLTPAEAAAVKGIYVQSKNISSLSGIEHFPNITELDCTTNNLSSLDISKNAALRKVTCAINNLDELDVTKNPMLHTLAAGRNQLTEIDLSKNPELSKLGLAGNQITSLDLSANQKLTEVTLDHNPLGTFTANLPMLTDLEVYVCQLTSLDITGCVKLEYLGCTDNKLTTLDLTKNPEMQIVGASKNQLTSLDISKNKKLTYVGCDNNRMTSLDITQMTNGYYDGTYSAYCGNQTSNGTTPQQLTLIMRNDQKYRWETVLYKDAKNGNVVVANN